MIGESRGGPTTKSHVVTDALGNPVRFAITEGHRHDVTQAANLIAPCRGANVIADRGDDSVALVEMLRAQDCDAVIPARRCSKPRPIDGHLYKEPALGELLFQKLKRRRRIAARYEELATTYSAMVLLAFLRLWSW